MKAGSDTEPRLRLFRRAALQEKLFDERAVRHRMLGREKRRYHFWRAALVGVLSGLAAVVFQLGLQASERVRESIVDLNKMVGYSGYVMVVLFCAALAGLSAWLTHRFAPEAAGSGIPHTKEVLQNLRPMRWLRVLLVKLVGGFLALGAGLSLGREGPTVHIGACLGKAVGEMSRLPLRSHRTLIASGAGAGLAAAFNAPLAGFLFVLEEIRRELTPMTYGTALIACASADAVTRILIGQRPAFRITGFPAPPLDALPIVILLGLVAGLLGVLFNKCLIATLRAAQRMPWTRALVIGGVAGLAVCFVPQVAGGGHHTAEIVLSGEFLRTAGVWIALTLMVTKFALTMISYSAGVPGGIFAPMLVIGAFLGLAFGDATRTLWPALDVAAPAFAVIGMAALFAAVTRAPITGVVLIVEMTGNYDQLYALILACLAAYLVAEGLRDMPIYEALVENDLRNRPLPSEALQGPALFELVVEPGSYLDGKQVESADLPENCAVISLLRDRNEFAPPAKMHIHAGDVVVIVAETNDPHLTYLLHQLARAL